MRIAYKDASQAEVGLYEIRSLQNVRNNDQKMPDLERCFEVNINVYSLQADKTVKPVFKSRELYKKNNKSNTMILNFYDNHLSYVTRFRTYAKKSNAKCAVVCFLVHLTLINTIISVIRRPS